MRTPLDPSALAALLARGWTGGPERVWRTTTLPADRESELRRRVAEAADALDHHPVLEQDPDGGTRWVLWTHSVGGVTELDATLAARIDALVDEIGGEPSGTP